MKEAGNLPQVGDDGEDAQAPAAAGTSLDVYREGPPEQHCPRSVARASRAARRGPAGCGSVVSDLAGLWLGHHQWTPLGSGCDDAEVAHGVEPGRRHERNEAAEQRQRVEVDSDGAVTERLLQSDAHEPIGAG